MPPPSFTWYQMQHSLLTNPNPAGVPTEEDKVYWWRTEDKNPNVEQPTALDDLLADMLAFAKGDMTATAFNNSITTDRMNNTNNLHFSRTKGSYANFTSALQLGAPRTNLRKLATDTYSGGSGEAALLGLTWYQVQYAILNAGALVTPEVAANAGYDGWIPDWVLGK